MSVHMYALNSVVTHGNYLELSNIAVKSCKHKSGLKIPVHNWFAVLKVAGQVGPAGVVEFLVLGTHFYGVSDLF